MVVIYSCKSLFAFTDIADRFKTYFRVIANYVSFNIFRITFITMGIYLRNYHIICVVKNRW